LEVRPSVIVFDAAFAALGLVSLLIPLLRSGKLVTL
jgi:hypothetical protein